MKLFLGLLVAAIVGFFAVKWFMRWNRADAAGATMSGPPAPLVSVSPAATPVAAANPLTRVKVTLPNAEGVQKVTVRKPFGKSTFFVK